MDANGLNFWMLNQQSDWALTPGLNLSSLARSVGVSDVQIALATPFTGATPQSVSVDSEVMTVSGTDATGLLLNVTRAAQGTVAASHQAGVSVRGLNVPKAALPNLSTLGESVAVSDAQVVLETPFSGTTPPFILIDSEVMSVSGADSTGLQLNVGRGAQNTSAANHPSGALVWAPVAVLQTDAAMEDAQLTVTPIQSGAIVSGVFLQIGSETLAVSGIQGAGTLLTVTRAALGSTAAAYSAGSPVFAPIASNTLYYCAKSKRLQLLSMRLGNPPQESYPDAADLVETTPMTRDSFGNYARWDAVNLQVMAGGSGPGEVAIYTAPAGAAVTDLAMGYDGILYIVVAGNLVMVDRQDRWPNFTLTVPGFTFWRLAALPGGGVLALDRSAPQLGTVTGTPLQTGPVDTPNPGILRSCQANPTPPQMTARYPLPSGETFVALTSVNQQFALLSWQADSAANTAAYLRLFDFRTGLGNPCTLSGVLWPYSIAWLGDQKLAVLATGLNEALAFDLSESGATLLPTGTTYILANNNAGPFAHVLSLPPHYAGGVKLAAPIGITGGTAALTLSSLATGRHPIRALYNGDANNPASASQALIQTVSAVAGSVGVSSSLNPAPAGQLVTFTARVTPATATGNVQFLDGPTVLGSVALSGGVATLPISTLTAGMHSVTAVYAGDSNNPAASSAVLVQTVVQAPFSVTITSSQNPSVSGQAVTLTAQVSPATATGNVQFLDGSQLLPLLPLSLNSMAAFGSTDPRTPKVIDSGKSQTVWHRLFLEAILPPRTSIVIWLTAADSPSGITSPTTSWYPHAFGDADMTALPPQTPKGAWLSIPSEVPFANPLLGADPVSNRQGLFMVLVQRAGRVVRNLSGRFLGIRVELHGDGRSTPEIAALRAWASRFSYVNNYLPELYRENKFSPAADQPGSCTRRDFFERFVDIFEAQLTRIEDRIANSYLLTRPESTPDSALDWLGGWIGMNGAGYPQDRRRARLLASAKLHRNRGTVKGITESLNIATNGLCSRGAVIVVEDFRLRHIFATILGADLDVQNDPLLPGFAGSSNSFVGDTLFLGNPRDQAEVLALFSAPENATDSAAVQQFYDSLANRMTVFVHNQVETVDVNLVTRIVNYEKPAHVAATVRIATQPFMVGLASLLGVDSYLAPEPPRDPVVVGTSQIGRYNQVIQAPSLDPRLEG